MYVGVYKFRVYKLYSILFHSILINVFNSTTQFNSALLYCVVFCFVLIYFILIPFNLSYSVLSYSILSASSKQCNLTLYIRVALRPALKCHI